MSADDLRLQPKITDEREIVLLVRTVPFDDAVRLIQSYGNCCRADGRLEQTVEYRNRLVNRGEDNDRDEDISGLVRAADFIHTLLELIGAATIVVGFGLLAGIKSGAI